MSKVENILASIIRENCEEGNVLIKKVKRIYNNQMEQTWDESRIKTLTSYFDENENFVVTKISAGKHLVSLNPNFEFANSENMTNKKDSCSIIRRNKRKQHTTPSKMKKKIDQLSPRESAKLVWNVDLRKTPPRIPKTEHPKGKEWKKKEKNQTQT